MRWWIKPCAVLILCSSTVLQAADDQPICPDRPSKSTGPCTVPAGRWQVETGLIDWSHERSGGMTSDLTEWAASGIKYGISSKADVELWITPLEMLRLNEAGVPHHHSSFGDMLVRVKYPLTSDSARVHVAVDPFVKLPTANRWLGNGKVEGGLLVPVAVPLGKSRLTLSLDPEVDVLATDSGRGYDLATQQVVNLGYAINDSLSVSGEVWGMWQAGTSERSADAAVAYLVSKTVQIDAGGNFGLKRATPDVELYTGISAEF
jgi:hypothetical protein